ncbi:unnamed protein product [Prorocentrum cordatum]|uniref:Mei2-like C-terminal RNA recognition motif domain-containing protein n=1 Tax=Prorocentrum cordatum TaxID=2364126 RepID=A0ABN9XJ03_9DINO|nr:unnamed protein product [Polarella glacialis]
MAPVICSAERVGLWAAANASPTEVTLFLSNLPTECTKSAMMKWMDTQDCMEGCDYLFVPRNFQSRACLGYAFANFVHPTFAKRLMALARGTSMKVTVSTDQGLAANLAKWATGRVHHIRDPENLPFVRALEAMSVKHPVMAAFKNHGPAIEEVPASRFAEKPAAAGRPSGSHLKVDRLIETCFSLHKGSPLLHISL